MRLALQVVECHAAPNTAAPEKFTSGIDRPLLDAERHLLSFGRIGTPGLPPRPPVHQLPRTLLATHSRKCDATIRQ
jgi:hypothetical protein